jgi:hypothetical protein
MNLDPSQIEETLFKTSSEEIGRFAGEHPNETFYGFFMDCDSMSGDVFLHLNTPEKLRERVESAKANSPDMYADRLSVTRAAICMNVRVPSRRFGPLPQSHSRSDAKPARTAVH